MKYPFKLPKLDYKFGDLEPVIDKQTMKIHYEKHHGGYVEKLNQAMEEMDNFKDHELSFLVRKWNTLPVKVQTSIKNNGGGHWNHSFFWGLMSPEKDARKEPRKGLMTRLKNGFGSLDEFKTEFEEKAMERFGSGWVWLVEKKGKKLQVVSTVNQEVPLQHDLKPILGLDLWEHAYYLKHQNKRLDYVKSWWRVLDWNKVKV